MSRKASKLFQLLRELRLPIVFIVIAVLFVSFNSYAIVTEELMHPSLQWILKPLILAQILISSGTFVAIIGTLAYIRGRNKKDDDYEQFRRRLLVPLRNITAVLGIGGV